MELDVVELIVVGVAAFATSILSALAGLGGGIILLMVIAQFHAPVVAIPIQGGIQLASNSSRAAMLRRQVSWPVVWRSALLLLPASLLGVAVATAMPENTTRLLLGLFVLTVTWRPQLLRWRGQKELPINAIVGVGAASGFLNTTVGASGPFTSPFFRSLTASHAAFVATAAASQVLAHTSKLIAFGLDGFDFAEHLPTMAVGAACVVAGSWVGTRLLGRADEAHLAVLFKTALTILALRLILRALL